MSTALAPSRPECQALTILVRRFNVGRNEHRMAWRSRNKLKIDTLARECAKADDGFTLREQRVCDGLPARGRYEE